MRKRESALAPVEAADIVPLADYPPNLREVARPYYDGICRHLEEIKRLRPAFAPAIVHLANILADIDGIAKEEATLDNAGDEISIEARILMGSRIATRKKDLYNLSRQLMDRFYMHPAAMEGVSTPRDTKPADVDTPHKAPIRRGL